MSKFIGSLYLGLFLMMAGPTLQADAQETADLQAAFGSVVSTSETSIVISQFNNETQADEEVTYAVDSKTALDGAATVTEIATGEEVEVLYEETETGKVARFITKEALEDVVIEEEPETVTDSLPSNSTEGAL